MILVTGSDGQLGKALSRVLTHLDVEHMSANRKTCDITRPQDIEDVLKKSRAKYIINCAAWTNVEKAEIEPSNAFLINHAAAASLAQLAAKYGIYFIHFSTDYVFDGEKSTPYNTDDTPRPLNQYGESKLAGENAIRQVRDLRYTIIRTSWLFSQYQGNFVSTMMKRATGETPSKVIYDQIGQPTLSTDLANFVVRSLLDQPIYGTIHVTNSGECTWYDLAKLVYELCGASPDLVQAIATSDYSSRVMRPRYSVLTEAGSLDPKIHQLRQWSLSVKSLLETTDTNKE